MTGFVPHRNRDLQLATKIGCCGIYFKRLWVNCFVSFGAIDVGPLDIQGRAVEGLLFQRAVVSSKISK
jgi:hypothetical protein